MAGFTQVGSSKKAAQFDDPVSVRILNAAMTQFQLLGLKRSSMEDIARKAKVGRITIYRRFAGKDALIDAVLFREIQQILENVKQSIAPLTHIEDRIETALVQVLSSSREHALVARLLTVEPDDVLPFLTTKASPILAIGSHFIAELIRAAQSEGLIAPYDPRPIAEILARLAHSLLLTPHGGLNLNNDLQIKAFAHSTIIPLIMNGTGQPLARP